MHRCIRVAKRAQSPRTRKRHFSCKHLLEHPSLRRTAMPHTYTLVNGSTTHARHTRQRCTYHSGSHIASASAHIEIRIELWLRIGKICQQQLRRLVAQHMQFIHAQQGVGRSVAEEHRHQRARISTQRRMRWVILSIGAYQPPSQQGCMVCCGIDHQHTSRKFMAARLMSGSIT
jgi:hypothetical protein